LKITSRDNQKLKDARKTRDGKSRDLVFVEGLRLAEECFRSDVTITEAFYTDHFFRTGRGNELIRDLLGQNVEVFEVSSQLFDSIADTKTSQGIAVIARKPTTGKFNNEILTSETKSNLPLFLLLHEINNPNNLGAVLRTAEAANVNGVILSKNSANAFSPKALRASMGAAFRIPIWDNATFSETLAWARECGLTSICAHVYAKPNYTDTILQKRILMVFGSEAHGLDPLEIDMIDEQISIPMQNNVESLNLAVSCGIILFEIRRQQFY
jgi:RNA methyltransferase, TrmH family